MSTRRAVLPLNLGGWTLTERWPGPSTLTPIRLAIAALLLVAACAGTAPTVAPTAPLGTTASQPGTSAPSPASSLGILRYAVTWTVTSVNTEAPPMVGVIDPKVGDERQGHFKIECVTERCIVSGTPGEEPLVNGGFGLPRTGPGTIAGVIEIVHPACGGRKRAEHWDLTFSPIAVSGSWSAIHDPLTCVDGARTHYSIDQRWTFEGSAN